MNNRHSYKTACPFILVLIMALLLTACSDGGGSDVAIGGSNGSGTGHSNGTNTPPGRTRLADLKAGDCTAPASNDLFVSEMDVVECSEPHDMQVAGRFTFADAATMLYPGFLAVQQRAYAQCQPVFEAFTGVAFWDSPYDINTITPSASTWADGDRETFCLIVNIDGEPMLASAR